MRCCLLRCHRLSCSLLIDNDNLVNRTFLPTRPHMTVQTKSRNALNPNFHENIGSSSKHRSTFSLCHIAFIFPIRGLQTLAKMEQRCVQGIIERSGGDGELVRVGMGVERHEDPVPTGAGRSARMAGMERQDPRHQGVVRLGAGAGRRRHPGTHRGVVRMPAGETAAGMIRKMLARSLRQGIQDLKTETESVE